ncbi:type II toxin-antitoxin system RelE/ParE family toxin [Edaphobacter sp. HDX4]|uniref:type II toxin-antitoxin system RelE/ParE family toxin n=1 Tax=Edaphobacter sp. HDX4 TaxID=2794064 RepID=UPI002FE59B16
MARFTVRPYAWREINKQLDYLEEQAGLETAERFLDSLISSFKLLAQTSQMGVRCGFARPATRRLRRWPVKGFENWLIFYQPKLYGVEIVHVMHGARDIETSLSN